MLSVFLVTFFCSKFSVPAPVTLASLRHLLSERFPAVPCTTGEFEAPAAERVLTTGIRSVDEVVGGIPLSAVTELVCAPGSGSHLFLGELLRVTRTSRTRVALVDGNDSFDPCSFEADLLVHLLWVRCHGTAEALQAIDLLARDANLGLVVLDLCRATEVELRRTPATQWYRLQRAVESTDLALLVTTPRPAVPSAQLRLVLDEPHELAGFDRERQIMARQLALSVQRQRLNATAVAS